MIGTIGGTYAPFCMKMASLFFKAKAQGHTLHIVVVVRSKIEKVPRDIRDEKSSKDMASSRNLVSTIGALASPKIEKIHYD